MSFNTTTHLRKLRSLVLMSNTYVDMEHEWSLWNGALGYLISHPKLDTVNIVTDDASVSLADAGVFMLSRAVSAAKALTLTRGNCSAVVLNNTTAPHKFNFKLSSSIVQSLEGNSGNGVALRAGILTSNNAAGDGFDLVPVIPYGFSSEELSLKTPVGDTQKLSILTEAILSGNIEVNVPGFELFPKYMSVENGANPFNIDIRLLTYIYFCLLNADGTMNSVATVKNINPVLDIQVKANDINRNTMIFKKEDTYNLSNTLEIFQAYSA